ncbi:hypothetical protein CC85DRAFT_327567 [Cutaneotrichosporon oleaginosum]|uniref:Uncharacterized protein n=1 Tax=Cutaneotrichosporon oleaginosum TaxID=879819 RepID=A0A0J0XQ51_9TREE|nr:uncharacterized protein CC85DRAFT_327567 [Cutaneotrichosporon oleaginosum]KLT43245.1 hypothetical protein CC85DRAFT_327567 [Cutaneotrichosporon oleaginosum]TXT09924.1 hypothetical protein COLE_03858 [Cutaneotrichosporon oleaginosum]
MAKPASELAPAASPAPAIAEMDDAAPPAPYRPNPKVAVVVAGAALAVTVGLTILVIPYVRQAAKIQAAEAAEHALKASARATRAEAGEVEAPLTFREKLDALKNAKTEEMEDEGSEAEPAEPVEPVSPWLGFQALGIATAIVGASAGLGVWGAAKLLGVNSMEEFAARMRGSLEETYPELIQQVRREGDEAPVDAPDLLTRHGEFNEPKFDDWIRGIEAEEAAAAAADKASKAGADASSAANYGAVPVQDSRVLAELAAQRARARQETSDVRLV